MNTTQHAIDFNLRFMPNSVSLEDEHWLIHSKHKLQDEIDILKDRGREVLYILWMILMFEHRTYRITIKKGQDSRANPSGKDVRVTTVMQLNSEHLKIIGDVFRITAL